MDAHHILEGIAKYASEVFRNPIFAVRFDRNEVQIQQGSGTGDLFAAVQPCKAGNRVKLVTYTEKGATVQALLTPEACKSYLGRLAEIA